MAPFHPPVEVVEIPPVPDLETRSGTLREPPFPHLQSSRSSLSPAVFHTCGKRYGKSIFPGGFALPRDQRRHRISNKPPVCNHLKTIAGTAQRRCFDEREFSDTARTSPRRSFPDARDLSARPASSTRTILGKRGIPTSDRLWYRVRLAPRASARRRPVSCPHGGAQRAQPQRSTNPHTVIH